MSTITKEFTKEQLQQIEAAAKEVMWPVMWSEKKAREHFSEKITPKVVLKLARIALASLEAEPVITVGDDGGDALAYRRLIQTFAPGTKLYTAPPAPVSVPANKSITQHFDTIALETAREIMCDVNRRHEFLGGEVQLLSRIQCRIDDACRAAMLQGAEPVTTAYKLRDAVETIRNSGIEIDAEKIFAERDALNSPVIPDGWVLVPVEPTEDMIVNGFESEPDESFSDERDWEAYDAMSGCQQAAHRAKLCWAAMIAASPAYKKS